MLTWGCERVRCELSAYHDEELPIADRIAIADHLETCPGCAVEDSDLRAISEALQVSGRSDDWAWMPGLGRFHSDIIERWAAEEQASLTRRIRNLFDDPRRASAIVSVSVVASLCIAMGSLVLAQGPAGHPDSLKALLMMLETRDADIYLPEGAVELPRADAAAVMPAAVLNRDGEDGDEESVAFAALVMADGHLTDLEILEQQLSRRGRRAAPPTAEELSEMLNAAATARFEPARVDGAPVSLNVVWMLTHRTVRAPLHARIYVRVDGWKTL
jgi:Putative zinc-finger